jgi:hypothetical protein
MTIGPLLDRMLGLEEFSASMEWLTTRIRSPYIAPQLAQQIASQQAAR